MIIEGDSFERNYHLFFVSIWFKCSYFTSSVRILLQEKVLNPKKRVLIFNISHIIVWDFVVNDFFPVYYNPKCTFRRDRYTRSWIPGKILWKTVKYIVVRYSLGRKIAHDYYIEYDNVSSGALYWLHNWTTGIEERIFTYEKGCIRFW